MDPPWGAYSQLAEDSPANPDGYCPRDRVEPGPERQTSILHAIKLEKTQSDRARPDRFAFRLSFWANPGRPYCDLVSDRAQRRPVSQLTLPGSFQYRTAERRSLGSLRNEPPRWTRLGLSCLGPVGSSWASSG